MLKGFPGHGGSQLRFAATAGIKAALRDLFDRSHFRPRRMENDDVEQDHTGVRVRWEDHLNPRPQRSLFSMSCLDEIRIERVRLTKQRQGKWPAFNR
jgi:hypothetical protein